MFIGKMDSPLFFFTKMNTYFPVTPGKGNLNKILSKTLLDELRAAPHNTYLSRTLLDELRTAPHNTSFIDKFLGFTILVVSSHLRLGRTYSENGTLVDGSTLTTFQLGDKQTVKVKMNPWWKIQPFSTPHLPGHSSEPIPH